LEARLQCQAVRLHSCSVSHIHCKVPYQLSYPRQLIWLGWQLSKASVSTW
jgi:hypothetical protein